MSRYVMCGPNQFESGVVAAMIARWEPFTDNTRHFVLLRCVIRVMNNLVEAGFRDFLPWFVNTCAETAERGWECVDVKSCHLLFPFPFCVESTNLLTDGNGRNISRASLDSYRLIGQVS